MWISCWLWIRGPALFLSTDAKGVTGFVHLVYMCSADFEGVCDCVLWMVIWKDKEPWSLLIPSGCWTSPRLCSVPSSLCDFQGQDFKAQTDIVKCCEWWPQSRSLLFCRWCSSVGFINCELKHALGQFAVKCEAVGMRITTYKFKGIALCRKLVVWSELLHLVEEVRYLRGHLGCSQPRCSNLLGFSGGF